MERASGASGGITPTPSRGDDPGFGTEKSSGSISEIKASCRRIAEYLLDVSRDERLEPALQEFLRTLERGKAKLDGETRERTERITESMKRRDRFASDGSVPDRCDPYFWG